MIEVSNTDDSHYSDYSTICSNCLDAISKVLESAKGDQKLLDNLSVDLHNIYDTVFTEWKSEPECIKEASDILHFILV